MNQNLNCNLDSNSSRNALQLPRLHHYNTYNNNNTLINQSPHSTSCGSSNRCKLGLGVNAKTGRLQWCPGFTCCKFLILLPVVMLPLTLVLILLMRMDGMLMALRIQEQQQQQQQQQQQLLQQEQLDQQPPVYSDDYGAASDAMDDIVSEQLLLPLNIRDPSEAERIRRCINFKFGLSETIDVEERDIMKDARTAFLPQDTTVIPRECLEALNLAGSHLHIFDEYSDNEELQHRSRRAPSLETSTDKASYGSANATEPLTALEDFLAVDDDDTAGENYENPIIADISDNEAELIENIAGLQSFWNEQGTRESIRQEQAKTMLKYIDTSVNPCNDFYKYACGNWEKLHPIPRDKAGFDTFEMLRENLDAVLKQLLEAKDDDEDLERAHLTDFISNGFEQDKKTQTINNADRLDDAKKNGPAVQPQLAADPKKTNAVAQPQLAANTKQSNTAVHHQDSKIVHINANSGSNANSNSGNSQIQHGVKAKTGAIAALDFDSITAIRLRRHIVRRRAVLSRILQRYRRQTANTKSGPIVPQHSSEDALRGHKEGTFQVHTKTMPPGSAQRKAKHLYQSCVNIALLAKRGIRPLLRLIDELGGWPVLDPYWDRRNFDWLKLTAQLRRYNNDILIVEWVGPDIKNSDENVIQFDQTSLGLPTREYYLQDINSKYLHAYQRFMFEVMQKLGAPANVASKTAHELIEFETQLASITSPAEKRLNVTKLYKRMKLRELHDEVPQINWVRYLSILQDRNVRDSEEVVIYAIDYMRELVTLLGVTKPRIVCNYLLWRFIRHRINNVDDRFEDSKQNFYHALFGREESPSRWKVCIAQVNTNMGMALGSMFVSKYFDENSKRDTLRMTHELQQAFREILKTTDWLDNSTKHLAELKVNAMSLKIGYPDFILNPKELNEKYAGIEIHPDLYFENTLNVLLHTAKTEQAKLHELVNKTAWQTAPAIVNAYYSRNKNQIMFPAGILQPPFYHRHFPRSLNFGGIGVVIGHELTHGFDDKGRLFDRNGSIHKWWTDASIRGFDERARCIIAQYSNYTVGEVGIALNGESTQGENIADNGGIRQAFHAYKRWLRENPNSAADERLPGIDMTGEQLFFLNFGQVWCGAMRPEAVRNKLNTAIHSPGRFRVIGTLSNSKDFAREFHCPSGSPMNPVHKCSVW